MRTLHAHPAVERLHLFGRGRLADDEAAEVAEHVSECAACAARLDQLPPDPFLAALRGARVAIDVPTSCHDARVTVSGPDALEGSGPLPPELLSHARYRIGELLGRGGMGAVYKAEHALMERPVALKVIAPRLLEHAGAAERFKQEVKAAARLQHPNIVTAFDAEQVGPVTVLVMEFVDGRSLADVLRAGGPLAVAAACDYARQAALGLAHAHEQGMAHRDVKPHNLMLTAEGRVKILDFGLARFVSDEAADPLLAAGFPSPSSLTQTGMCMGTPDYMAPEQAIDSRSADARSDVYALGATLYHLLAGRVPFDGGTAYEKLARLATTDPEPLSATRPDLPPGLAAVVGRMMAKRPADRFRTAVEAAAALAPFTEPVAASRVKRRLLVAVTLFALLVTLAAGVVKIATDRGEVTIQTDDPDIEVVIKGERIVRIRDPKTGGEYVLDRTDLTLSQADGDGLQVTLGGDKPVVLKRNGKQIAIVRLAVPAKAVAAGTPTAEAARPVEVFRTAWPGTDHVSTLAFSPDGKDLLVGRGTDGSGRVFDLATGKVRLEQHGLWIGTYRPSGAELLSGRTGTVYANDAQTGKELRKVAPEFGDVGSLYLAPDGATVILGTPGGVISLWDVASGKKLKEWEKGRSVFISPVRGEILLARDINAPDAVFDITTGQERPAPKEYSRLVGLANGVSERFGPDRVVTWVGQALIVYDRADGKLLHTVDLGSGMNRLKHRGLGVGPGGRFVVHTGADTATAVVREVATGKELAVLRLGGKGVAYQCAVSADGRRVAVANQLGDVAVWELPESRIATPAFAVPVGRLVEERVFAGHVKPWAFHPAISPDGRYAATGACNTAGVPDLVRLWRLDTGEEVRTFDTRKDRIGALSFTSAGELLVSGEKALWAWDTARGGEPRRAVNGPRPQGERFGPFAGFSADGRRAVSADETDFSLRVWDLGAAKVLRTMRGHSGEVLSIAVSPDGKRAVSGSRDKTARVWDLDTGTELKGFDSLRDVWAVRFAPDGRTVAFGGGDGTVCLCDPDRGWAVRRLAYHPDTNQWFTVRGLSFTPDGTRLLVSESNIGELILIDVASGRVLDRVPTVPISQLAVSPDGKRVVTAHSGGEARVWRLEDQPPDASPKPGRPPDSGDLCRFERHVGTVGAADISADGRRAVTGGTDGRVRLWDAATGKELARFDEPTGRVRTVTFSRDGKRVLVCGLQVVFLWDLESNKASHRFAHPGFVHCAALSPDGKVVLTGDGDGRTGVVRVWDVKTGREVHRLIGHTAAVSALAFSPDGGRALSASHDQTVRLWDVNDRRQIHSMAGHTGWVEGVAYSPDGRRAVSAGRDDTARVWDLNSGKEVYAFECPDGLTCATFLPGGGHAVVGAESGTVWVLDPEKRTVVTRLRSRTGACRCLTPLPSGRQMLSANDDGTVRLFRLPESGVPNVAPVPVVPAAPPPLAPPLSPLAPPPPAPLAPTGPTIPRVSPTTRFPVFHPDGQHLLTPDGNDVTVWNVATREKVKTFTGLADRVMAVRLTAGGNTVVALSNGKRVMAWDWASGKKLGEFHAPAMPEPIALCVFPDGKRVAIPAEPGFVSVRELPAGNEVARIDLHDTTEWVCTLAPSPDGRWLAVIGKQGRAHVWDTTVGKVAAVLPGVPLSMNHAVGGFSSDGKYLGVGASAALRVWRVGEWAAKPTVVTADASGLVAFDDTGAVTTAPVQPFNRVVAACRWDAASGVAGGRMEFALAQAWNHCGLSPDGRTLAVDVEARRSFVLTPLPVRPPVAPMPRAKDAP